MKATAQQAFTLINPQTGNLAFKVFHFDDGSHFDHLQRYNYYSLIWITDGSGTLKSDFSEHLFEGGNLFAFSPYQPFMFLSQSIRGVALHFHPDFFCIHKHQSEIACNGVLFNNIYHPPFIQIDAAAAAKLAEVISRIKSEIQAPALAQYELLIAYLKILLINCSRLKTEQQPDAADETSGLNEPFILQTLKTSIEKNFKQKHAAGDYASELCLSTKALAKITKTHFRKTLTQLISERIIIEAKRELYLTNKAVKEIAYELGYDDEYYFSRFFKVNTNISPQTYRDTVGFGRGDSK